MISLIKKDKADLAGPKQSKLSLDDFQCFAKCNRQVGAHVRTGNEVEPKGDHETRISSSIQIPLAATTAAVQTSHDLAA